MPSSVGRQNAALPETAPAPEAPLATSPSLRKSPEPSRPVDGVVDHPNASRSSSPVAQAEEALRPGVSNWFSEDHQVAQTALVAFESIPKGQLEGALAALDKKGLLQRFFDKASPEQRDALLDLAVGAGFLRRTGPAPTQATPGTLNPPSAPALILNSDRVRTCMEDAVQASNLAANRGYARDFDTYANTYAAAARAAKSGSDLRDLGPPALPATLKLPSEEGHRAHAKFALALSGLAPSTKAMTDAFSARRLELIGEMKAGSLFVDVQIKRTQDVETHLKGVKVEGTPVFEEHLILAAGREPEVHHKAGSELKVGHVEVEALRDTHGELTAKVGVGGLSVAANAEGVQLEAQLSAKKLGFTGPGAAHLAIGTYAWIQPEEGRMAAGVTIGNLKVGLGTTGLSLEKAVEAFGREYYLFDAQPKGLAEGTPWSKLPDDVRAKLERFDWSADEWARRQAALQK